MTEGTPDPRPPGAGPAQEGTPEPRPPGAGPAQEGSPAPGGGAPVVHTPPGGAAEEVAAGPAGERPTRPAVPEAVRAAAAVLQPRLAERPAVALVLGSGLGGLADEVEDATRIPAAELPGMPGP